KVPVGQDELVKSEFGVLPELVDQLLSRAEEPGPARWRRARVQLNQRVGRRPDRRGVTADLMARLDQRRPVNGGLLRATPGVPLVGVPDGDPEHARAAG